MRATTSRQESALAPASSESVLRALVDAHAERQSLRHETGVIVDDDGHSPWTRAQLQFGAQSRNVTHRRAAASSPGS